MSVLLHHIGEELVARMIKSIALAGRVCDLNKLSVYSPKKERDVLLKQAIHVDLLGSLSTQANAEINNATPGPRFDGMHKIDCAIFSGDDVIPLEIKLGMKRLGPKSFFKDNVLGVPYLNPKNAAIDGDMVAILDWNGRSPPFANQPEISLSAKGRSVLCLWLLILRHSVLNTWKKTPNLLAKLNTKQLVGVLSFEALVELVGADATRWLSLEIAYESISKWKWKI